MTEESGFEYVVLGSFESGRATLERLNEFGQQGWQVVSVTWERGPDGKPNGDMSFALLMRPFTRLT